MKSSDKILAFVAIFISCLALFVSIVQTTLLQKQSKAAVWPRIVNGQGQGPDYYIYTVSNVGVGPAIVSSISYTYKDTSFQYINKLVHYFGELESAEINGPVKLNFNYSNLIEGSVFIASEKNDVFIANDSISVKIGKKYLSETDIQINYCSIYDECWTMDNDKTIELK